MTPFDKEMRRALTPKQRAEFFAKHDGKCQNCGRKIRSGENWDVDHVTALCNQGSNDETNLQLLCQNCHGAKTKVDRKTSATNKRKYTSNIVPKKHKRSGFRGHRKFNGDIVWNNR